MDIQAKIKTLLAVSGIIGLTIVFHYLDWLSPVENFLRRLIRPGGEAMYTLSVRLASDTEEFYTPEDLARAYETLHGEYREALVKAAEAELLREENSELRDMLAFFRSSTLQHVGAEIVGTVVGRNIEPLGNTMVIDKGSRDSVQVGNPVIVHSGVLVGKIIRVEEEVSIIQLITDGESKVAATVMNQEKSLGIIEGGYGVSIRMTWIPQNEKVTVGDTIVTSGLEKGIPRGLLIGTVDVVEQEPYQAFQRAIISPLADLNKIRLVSVIITS